MNRNMQNKIYLYCIMINTENREVPTDFKSLGNGDFVNISYKDVSIIGEHIQSKVKDIKAGILIHEKNIEKVMDHFDVLPMRFNSLIKDKITALTLLKKNYSTLKKNFIEISGKAEYGIKVIWNYDQLYKEKLNKINNKENKIKGKSPASEYLKKRFEKYKVDELIIKQADECIDQINTFLNKINHKKVLKKLQTENLLLNASFLINKKDESIFKEACANLKKSANQDFKFLFSGPWPPYNFVKTIKLK